MVRTYFLIASFMIVSLSALSAQKQAVEARAVAVERPSAYFQGRLEKLYKAIEQKDQTQVARYERELMQSMRDALRTTTIKEERLQERLQVVFQQFEGFSFTQAPPNQQDAYLALLEEFLAILQIND